MIFTIIYISTYYLPYTNTILLYITYVFYGGFKITPFDSKTNLKIQIEMTIN